MMTNLVDRSQIERLVGAKRRPTMHLGRTDSEVDTFYILHSKRCLDSGIDLRECRYSLALDQGIDMSVWENYFDEPVTLRIVQGRLVPGRAL